MSDNMTPRTCSTCRYMSGFRNEYPPSFGPTCRYEPPRLLIEKRQMNDGSWREFAHSTYPPTHNNNTCGKWEASE